MGWNFFIKLGHDFILRFELEFMLETSKLENPNYFPSKLNDLVQPFLARFYYMHVVIYYVCNVPIYKTHT